MTNKRDILLIKHFMGETTPDEEILVAQYKHENSAEYKALKRFWLSEGNIKPIDFNTQRAFDKVKNSVKNKPKTKVINLYPRIKQLGIAVSILLTIGVGIFWLQQELAQPEIILATNTTISGGKTITLPDGSTVTLNKNAVFSYPDKFSGKTREVNLKGEAFFEVAKDKQHPFIIKMETTKVTVLGTSFNIKNSEQKTEVAVATGKVRVNALKIGKSVDITPGQSAMVEANTIEQFSTINKNYSAWKTGKFIFSDTPIQQVIADLNTYYNNKIDSSNLTENSCKITATFNQQPLSEVVEVLELTCGTKINIKK